MTKTFRACKIKLKQINKQLIKVEEVEKQKQKKIYRKYIKSLHRFEL